MAVRPLVTLDLADAPTLDQASFDPLRLRRQSHVLLDRAEYSDLRELITDKVLEMTNVHQRAGRVGGP